MCTHTLFSFVLQKEVIQPHLPVRLPCYDFTPLTRRTLDSVLLAVRLPASGTPHSDGVTGGVYKAVLDLMVSHTVQTSVPPENTQHFSAS